MLSAFSAQCAAGCLLAVSVVPFRQLSWRYLRLMAIVSLALTTLTAVFLVRETSGPAGAMRVGPVACLAAGTLFAIIWLFVNAAQADRVRDTQGMWPAAAGVACLLAAIILALAPDSLLRTPQAVDGGTVASAMAERDSTQPRPADAPSAPNPAAVILSTTLGAMLLGCVTAGMLLGHRYLTDTDLSIAPLRRLAGLYLGAVVARIIWAAAVAYPVWFGAFRPAGGYVWFWLAVSVRVGVGLVGTAVFAYMVWDCVRRRATQSATAIFYLSMVFVFFGELAGQYLLRAEALPL